MVNIKNTLHGALRGIGSTFVQCVERIVQIYHDDTGWIDVNGVRMYVVASAITANVTTTTAPAGSMAATSNATGRGLLFFSDGAHWQVSTAVVPVKATGAELDTGTDDAKFATAKALADSGFINKTGISALTDNSGGAAADGTIGVVTLPNLASWDGATVFPSAAQATAIIAAITANRDAVKELSTKLNALINE
jgi:hypothetical protein